MAHQGQVGIGIGRTALELRAAHRQPGFGNQRRQALHQGGIDQPQTLRQMGRHHHAATDGFAMQPLAITQTGLDGMAKGVAEIQNGAQAVVALVLRHHPGLDLATAFDGVGQRTGVARHQGTDVGLNPVQKRQVGNRAVFDDFGQPGADFALCQGVNGVQIAHHQQRLVKRADHVLAHWVVDGGFAADRRVHLRQQRGGHLHKGHAAHVAGSSKAGHVADHPATEREQYGFAVAAVAEQAVKNQVQGFPGFVRFTVRQRHQVDGLEAALQSRLQALCVQRGHRDVGHDQCGVGRRQRGVAGGIAEQPRRNQDRVAALVQSDVDTLNRRGK